MSRGARYLALHGENRKPGVRVFLDLSILESAFWKESRQKTFMSRGARSLALYGENRKPGVRVF